MDYMKCTKLNLIGVIIIIIVTVALGRIGNMGQEQEIQEIEEKNNSDSGVQLLGGAMSIKQYRTLADAEEQFGSYLGLYNTLSTKDNEYNLIDMHIIGKNRIMMATFENSKDKEIGLVVKLSEKLNCNDIARVYTKDFAYMSEYNYNGNKVKIGGADKDNINLIKFKLNKRNYVVYSQGGLRVADAEEIVGQIIENVASKEGVK